MHKLHLPRLGQTMERGTILRWFKKEEDSFDVGEVLYEVETEKVVSEIEAKLPGTLAHITAPEGEELPVGTLLAVVADPGEELSDEEIQAAISEEESVSEPTVAEDLEQAQEEREPAPTEVPPKGSRARAMPKARARARELGVDLSAVEGTGRGGVITAEDVERAASALTGPSASGAEDAGPKVRERRPLRGGARAMAEVVSRSWREVPQFVQMVELDASALVRRRREEARGIKETYGVDLSYTDLLLEALVSAVEEEPLANSSLRDDEVIIYEDVNLSVAVAAERGLLVPVVHHAQRLSLGDLAVRFRELASKAREGRLSSEDVEGGTITLSNLGMHGVEGGTPLVTSPQSTVAFFGTVVEKPWVVEGRVEVRSVMSLSVGYDHRILDGATAARFTTALRKKLEGAKQP